MDTHTPCATRTSGDGYDIITLTTPTPDLADALHAAQDHLAPQETLVRLTATTFRIAEGPAATAAARIIEGDTYRAVAEHLNLSSEYIRRATAPFLTHPESAAWHTHILETRRADTLAAAREADIQAALEYADAHPGASLPEISRAVKRRLTSKEVAEALGPARALQHPVRGPNKQTAKKGAGNPYYTDEECVEAIKTAATLASTDALSTAQYEQIMDEHRASGHKAPSQATIVSRFGSWRAACEAAGVATRAARSRGRETWTRQWTDEELFEWARRYFAEVGPLATNSRYDEWVRGKKGPSMITLRKRLGRWSAIRARAAAQTSPEQ